MTFYSIYRWIMLGITLFNLVNVIFSILEYKKYYDQVPSFLRKYLQKKTVSILGKKVSENNQGIRLNLGLLAILIALNIVFFVI